MAEQFETELAIGIGTLTGGIRAIKVQEKDAQGSYKDSLIIRNDREWKVTIDWALMGDMLDVHWLDIRGNWLLKVYLEGMGVEAQESDHKGDTAKIQVEPPQATGVLGVPPQTAWLYTETFTFKPKTVKPGTYRLSAAITFEHDPGKPGPMAGFIEFGNMIQIYDAGD